MMKKFLVLGFALLASTAWAVPPPSFTPSGGVVTSGQAVVISDTVGSSYICETIDGSIPTGTGGGSCTHGTFLANNGTVTISLSLTLNAIACPNISSTCSTVTSANYTVTLVSSGSGLLASGGIAASGALVATGAASLVAITTTSPVPNCSQSIPFSFPLNATGGNIPYTWALLSGPLQPGLSLSAAGVLSGTCTNGSGTVTFAVQVCDSSTPAQCNSGTFQQTAQTGNQTLYVCDSISSPTTCANPPATGVTGTYYQYNFQPGGGTSPYTWSLSSGTLPTGITLATSGSFLGFPSAPGAYSFTVQVTDSTTPTPQTATAAFTVTITGFSGNPQIAPEPQSYVSTHQGGQNTTTGNPCAQSDTGAGACTWGLPKTCNAANHCIHEQLGFGSNDHASDYAISPLTALYDANCDWATNQLGGGFSGQNWSLWVEMKNGVTMSGAGHGQGTLVPNQTYYALYNGPTKISGQTSPGCGSASTSTPVGPYTISLSGGISGTLQLGETIQQATTGATATLLFVGCSTDTPPLYPRPCVNGVAPTVSPTSTPQGPVQIGQIQGGTADGTHVWTGQTSGASFTPSAVPATNGYFRLTGQCSAGAGSGSPLTPGYPVGSNDTPCNNLTDQPPCYHNINDATLINNPSCTSPNDLASMFTFELTTVNSSGYIVVEQQGNNTFLSGFEATIAPGSNQSMTGGLCGNYFVSGTPVNCNILAVGLEYNCAACVRDHLFIHGQDPGDAGQETFAASVTCTAGVNGPAGGCGGSAGYPVDPNTGHHECPGWSYNQAYPSGSNMVPLALVGPQQNYSSGCGDDLVEGIRAHSGGYTADEHITVAKIHAFGTEAHLFTFSNGADNMNPTGNLNILPGAVNVGCGGLNGPEKISDVLIVGGGGGGLFVGGVPVNTNCGVMTNMEVTRFRAMQDPGWRYLSAGAGHSPQSFLYCGNSAGCPSPAGYGCGTPPNPQSGPELPEQLPVQLGDQKA